MSGGLGGAVWAATGEPWAVPVAVAVGVLTDVDHLVDVFDGVDEGRPRHMLRPFHAWEFAAIGVFALFAYFNSPLFLAALLGYISHMALDQVGNTTNYLAYLITYRASVKFNRRRLTPHVFSPGHWSQSDHPFWAKYEPTVYQLWRWYKARESRGDGNAP
ncbi:MAG: hypothetical protein IIC83_11070 [Chloroflexi bacterium]|nr:hypothetical protein [Chloroflexota bacterium]MCH7652965.1 hypothetical protein [Chloroflexota bacterium]